MTDASFEDGREAPLNLGAEDADDLQVISTLTQDAVFPITEMTWRPSERRFGLLLNRFRWEDKDAATRRDRPFERVQSVLVFDSVLSVASQGVDRSDKDMVMSLLSRGFRTRRGRCGRDHADFGRRRCDPSVGRGTGCHPQRCDPALSGPIGSRPSSSGISAA